MICIVTTFLARTVSEILPVSQCMRLSVTLKIPPLVIRHVAYEHVTDNMCHISRGMGVTKVSNSKSDFQGHSRSLLLVPFDKPHMIPY